MPGLLAAGLFGAWPTKTGSSAWANSRRLVLPCNFAVGLVLHFISRHFDRYIVDIGVVSTEVLFETSIRPATHRNIP